MNIGFIGCGNMGEALLKGAFKKHRCFVCEPRAQRQEELYKKYRVTFGLLADVVASADVLLLAVKPQDLPDIFAEMRGLLLEGKLIISIAAGVTTATIQKSLGPVRVVRVMPNLPAMIGQGVSGLCRGKQALSEDMKFAQEFMSVVGGTVVVDEKMMDALTAVSGSGPAYVFLFVECLMKAARKLGFSHQEARTLVYSTLQGSARMLAQSDETPEALRLKVTSKGGTTQAATDVFMKKGLEKIFEAALKAARDRARELSK